jgi:1-acyl-sn-glycerol-3-phosphate acyltransferase
LDPAFIERVTNTVGPLLKKWFRPEVRGLDALPPDGALVVSNHSGGMLTPDVLIFASAFYRRFGYDRPLYTLGHDALFVGPLAKWSSRVGLIRAGRKGAAIWRVVPDFPGGVYDAYRPTLTANVIDFTAAQAT